MKRFLIDLSDKTVNEKRQRSGEVCNSETLKELNVDEINVSKSVASTQLVEKYDVGNFVKNPLSDADRLNLLKNPWVPDKKFDFPLLEKFKERKLKFCYKWFDEFSWLAYSKLEQGAFCLPCVLFAKCGGHGSQPLGALVKTKFDNWKKAKETFNEHNKKLYHIICIADRDMFLKTMQDTSKSVENLIDTANQQQKAQNRKNLIPIVEAIIVVGRQEISLRGHRDSGKIVMDNNLTDSNEGNFRALLKYRAKGDEALRTHLEGPGERNKYTSPGIQNEIIDACYVVLTEKVIIKIKNAKFFSILADETRDVSTIEQVTNCIRYVEKDSNAKHIVREDFLNFTPTVSTTGEALAELIIKNLQQNGIDISFLIGQGYDGGSNMSGKFKGVQSIIREKYAPHALYVHCAAHSLNLAISITSRIPAIRDCLSTIEKVYEFFNTPKRKPVLEKIIEESEQNPRTKTLKRLSLTRWVSKYNDVSDFIEIFLFVYKALDNLKMTESDAKMLQASMDFEFLISLFIINRVYQLSLPLSREFQKINVDMVAAVHFVEDLCAELEKIRNDECFSDIYKASEKIAKTTDVEVKHNRIASRQKHRANPDTQTTDQYFRVTVFYPFIDYYLTDLKERFLKHGNILKGFAICFAKENKGAEDFQQTVEFYKEFLDEYSLVFAELQMWKHYLDHDPTRSALTGALEALDNCPQENFPNIYTILKILATLPVSTSTAERTFSSLKIIKTIHCIRILAICISPNQSINTIIELIHESLIKITKVQVSRILEKDYDKIPLILSRDFNINFASDTAIPLIEFLGAEFNLKMCSSHTASATRSKTVIDAVSQRFIDRIKTKVFISYFSYHKPLVQFFENVSSDSE